MGQAARNRAHDHVARAQREGGCRREHGGPCSVCRHPPKLRAGDVIDFERTGHLAAHEAAVAKAKRRGWAVLGVVALAVLFAVVGIARCAGG